MFQLLKVLQGRGDGEGSWEHLLWRRVGAGRTWCACHLVPVCRAGRFALLTPALGGAQVSSRFPVLDASCVVGGADASSSETCAELLAVGVEA